MAALKNKLESAPEEFKGLKKVNKELIIEKHKTVRGE